MPFQMPTQDRIRLVNSDMTNYAWHRPSMPKLALRINSEIGIILKGVRYGKYAQTKNAENDINA